MAGPTRISQLTDGAPVQETDQIPVARGSGASGYTYKVNAGRLVSDLLNVTNSPSVNLSFNSSTRTLSADVVSTVDASVNVVDSSTIDLDWNASTRTLSANANYLLTLINTLSTNMQNIGNYPYLEYAWVTELAAAGQTVTANLSAVLSLNQELQDTQNNGSLNSNQITLLAGTYEFDVDVSINMREASIAQFALYDYTSDRYIARSSAISDSTSMDVTSNWFAGNKNNHCVRPNLKGRFTLNQNSTISIICLPSVNGIIGYPQSNGGSSFVFEFTSNSVVHQRTTIKLWKVG